MSTTTRFRPRSVLLLLGALGLLAVAACGGSATGSDTASAADGEAFANRAHGAIASSPLAEALGLAGDRGSAVRREADKQREEAVATCMRAQGFDYLPVVAAPADAGGSDGGLTERQFAERWGFGWYTTMNADGSTVEGAPSRTIGSVAAVDPNDALVAAMSDAERTAYAAALYGAEAAAADGTGPESEQMSDEPPSLGGCLGAAIRGAGAAAKAATAQELLGSALAELADRVGADRRVKAAARDYRSCMAAAGFPKIKQLDDVQTVMTGLVGDLYAKHPEAAQRVAEQQAGAAGAGASDEGADPAASAADSAVPGAAGGAGVATDPKILAEAQSYERRLATAELPCKGAYELAHERVAAEYEREYVRDHRDLVDAAKAG